MDYNEKKITETLESWDGTARAEANPYLFEKIRLRMNRVPDETKFLYSRPMFKLGIAAILVFTVLNTFSLVNINSSQSVAQTQNETAGSLASEYDLQVNGYNY